MRARDAALLGLLYGGGLRRAEAVALDVADYDPTTGALAIRHGKGRQQRMVYATNGSSAALVAWLAIRGDAPGALFLPATRHGRLRADGRLTPHAVFAWLSRLTDVPANGRVRRTICVDRSSRICSTSVPTISTVQKLAGHRRCPVRRDFVAPP
jgi:integrase/recombinase XerD